MILKLSFFWTVFNRNFYVKKHFLLYKEIAIVYYCPLCAHAITFGLLKKNPDWT